MTTISAHTGGLTDISHVKTTISTEAARTRYRRIRREQSAKASIKALVTCIPHDVFGLFFDYEIVVVP
jgi:hypothetical protein